jgi:hypothetical protein
VSQRIRLGNVYQHDEHGEILTVHRDDANFVWYREVVGRDNGGVVSTSVDIHTENYRDLLGNVSMLDYPDNWDDIARAVRKRDNGTCQSCGADNTQLHVHHIVSGSHDPVSSDPERGSASEEDCDVCRFE